MLTQAVALSDSIVLLVDNYAKSTRREYRRISGENVSMKTIELGRRRFIPRLIGPIF